jgi:hypothetical protein
MAPGWPATNYDRGDEEGKRGGRLTRGESEAPHFRMKTRMTSQRVTARCRLVLSAERGKRI